MTKDCQINVRCSEEQKINIKNKAKKLGLSMSSFLLHSAIIYSNDNKNIPNVYTNTIQSKEIVEERAIIPIKRNPTIKKTSNISAEVRDVRKNMFKGNSVKNILKKAE